MIKKDCRGCWYYCGKKEAFDKKKNEFIISDYCDHPTKDGQKVGLLEKTTACSQFKERQKTAGFNLKKYGTMAIAGVCAFLAGFPVPGDFGSLLYIGGGILGGLGGVKVLEARSKGGKKDGN